MRNVAEQRKRRIQSSGGIDDALDTPIEDEAVHRAVADAIGHHRAARSAYQGGLAAERQSWRSRRTETRSAIRAQYLAGVGRRIDLVALLRQRDQQGRPVWTVADPTRPLDAGNGQVDGDGDVCVRAARPTYRNSGPPSLPIEVGRPVSGGRDYRPDGIPALPDRARELATDETIRRRANWVGVLYQPQIWHEVDPDPAIVVEWRDRPGEFYCLAIWGGDRAAIEEFAH